MLVAAAVTWAIPTITATAALVIGHAVVLAGTLVFGAVQQRRAKARARASTVAQLEDRTVSVIAADAPLQIIYGEPTVGGVIAAILTSGDHDQYKHLVIVWAGHECEQITDLLINGTSIGALDAYGQVTGGRWFQGTSQMTSESVTFDGSGSATLAHPPIAVHSVSRRTTTTGADGRVTATDVLLANSGISIAGSTITKAALAGLTATVSYTWGSGRPMVRALHHVGFPGQTADAVLTAACPADWTSTDRLRELCYSVVSLDLGEPEFQGGPPQITARVKGRRVVDTRDGITRWTANPALCLADFLQARFGKQALSAQVGTASVTAAANVCDEALASHGGAARYTCNGAFKTDADPDATLTALCQAMAGFATYSGGAWTLQAGAYTAPVMALTDADNDGAVEVVAAPAGVEVFNGLRGRFYDPARFDQATDYTPYQNAAFVAEDGAALWDDLPLPFTNADWRCANLARIFVERGRGMQLVYPAKHRARALRVGQRVTLTNSVLGMSAAVFRVVKREHRIGEPVKLTLAQDAASIYDEADAPASLDSPSVFGPSPFVVGAVAGLTVVSDVTVAQWNVDGTVIGNTRASWTASADVNVTSHGALQMEYREAEAAAWTRMPEAPGESTGQMLPLLAERRMYLVRARWRNGVGAVGDWAYASVLTDRLPAVRGAASLIDATWWEPGATLQWLPNSDAAGENSIVWKIGPRDLWQPVWKCVGAGAAGSGRDGGWQADIGGAYPRQVFVADTGKTYRFAVPVFVESGTGSVYWGPYSTGVCDLNTSTPNGNPYFASATKASLTAGRWYLMVGYVFPAGSTGMTHAGAGIYDLQTGALKAAGTNFCWAAGTAKSSTRAYQYYSSTGGVSYFGLPVVEMLDGYEAARVTYLGTGQVATGHLAPYSASDGTIFDSSETVGSSGSPGASVRVATMWGPAIATVADDVLDINVSGVLDETFWSQAAIASVELWLNHAPSFGGTLTEFGTRRKYASPVDVYTAHTQFDLSKQEQIAPGAVTKTYALKVSITYRDAAGAAKQCGKDFDATAQWKVVQRKR